MANRFCETVAMDLKEFDGKIILHIIDMCTRLSAGTFVKNKKARIHYPRSFSVFSKAIWKIENQSKLRFSIKVENAIRIIFCVKVHVLG